MPLGNSPANVLFLCTGNSARSILAEAILNRLGEGRFNAFSAGSAPKDRPHPHAIRLLKSLNHDVSGLRSKDWAEFARPDAPDFHLILTVCDNAAAETCPIWPGKPVTVHWGMPDPAAVIGSEGEIAEAFAKTYRDLHHRINKLVALPIHELNASALKHELKRIASS